MGENRRLPDGRINQRHVLYLGELNARQERSWRKTVQVFEAESSEPGQKALFAEEHLPKDCEDNLIANVGVRLSQMRLERPRQWGACWLGCALWQQLGLADFWRERLPQGRQGARWDHILQTLALYRLIDPGSEWRLHRHWFDHSAVGGRYRPGKPGDGRGRIRIGASAMLYSAFPPRIQKESPCSAGWSRKAPSRRLKFYSDRRGPGSAALVFRRRSPQRNIRADCN